MKNPCHRDCPHRRPACHAVCPDYKAFRVALDRKNEKLRREREVYAYRSIRRDHIAALMRDKHSHAGVKRKQPKEKGS